MMCDVPGPVPTIEIQPESHFDLHFLVELPPRHRVFVNNVRDLIRPSQLPALRITSAPAAFWPDVFVKRGLPWRRFLESGGYHVLALALLVFVSRFLAMRPQPQPRSTFDSAQVIYYQPDEYLPPLDTRPSEGSEAVPAEKADPEFSRQDIISVPAEADNRAQTIVAAPSVKLNHDVPLPNIVAWSDKPQLPIAPPPVVPASNLSRLSPQLEDSVVAPPPDLRASANTAFHEPQPAVIAPPPSLDSDSARRLGDVNIGHTSVIAPAPQLPLGEQRAIPAAPAPAGVAPQVVPPPPSLGASGTSAAGGRVVALNLHPSIGAPPQAPPGNRRGTFSATPEGRSGASGNPGSDKSGPADSDGGGRGGGSGSGKAGSAKGSGDLPSGLYVGRAANPANTAAVAGTPATKIPPPANSVNPNLLASFSPPRVTSLPARGLQPDSETKLSEAERAVFGNRKFYSLTFNMPNLNSAGGSWVVRFVESSENSNGSSGQLSAPAATRKVDPGYPLELMRENVSGTVILYAVIHTDGSVGNVRVLRSVDDRIDQFASRAVAQWKFEPATRDGAPVVVEATFQIPFRPARRNF